MSTSAIEIINGKYWNKSNWTPFSSLKIKGGVILSIDENSPGFKGELTIDANGGIATAGLFDLNASLREPGGTRNGTIASETKAAAAGGVVQLCCTPDTSPINDTKAVTKLIREQASNAYCSILPLGALTRQLEGEQLSAHASLKDAGCIALSNASRPLSNLLVTQRCFEYAKTQEMPVFITPMERDLYEGCMHEGPVSAAIGLKGIPAIAESIAVAQLLQLARATGVQLHLSQISCARSVELIEQAKAEGTNVSADVAIANLLYTDESVQGFNSHYHCIPPLRTELDRQALLRGVNNRSIDAICSAHRPLESAEKLMPFAETSVGMSTIESLIPAAMRLQKQNELNLEVFFDAMGARPRKLLDLDPISIEKGATASITVVDDNYQGVMSLDTLKSKGKNTLLGNENIGGKVLATINQGQPTYIA